MKTKTLKDQNGVEHSVSIPDDGCAITMSVGVYGWSVSVMLPGLIRIEYFNGQPTSVSRMGKELWSSYNRDRWRKQATARKAQKIYWDYVHPRSECVLN